MVKLSNAQLVVCWVILSAISALLVLPAFKLQKTVYRYQTQDGWRWDWPSRSGESVDDSGRAYRISENDPKNRIYYYASSSNKYELDRGYPAHPKHPHERIALVIFLNGALLTYTLGRGKKPH